MIGGLVFWTDGAGPLRQAPVTAKIVASVVTYVGNGYWTS